MLAKLGALMAKQKGIPEDIRSKHKDKPREEIIALAERIISESHGTAKVYFKFTCEHCYARQHFEEENTLYDIGTCEECGKVTTIIEAGFMLVLTMDGRLKDAS